jgi:tellurite resistance protein TerB
MGFLDSLKGIASNFMADAEKALSRMSDKATFIRTVQASYLVAAADGNVSDEEKVVLGRVIAKKLPSFKSSEVAKAIDDCAEEMSLSAVAGKVALMESIEKAAGTDGAKVIMLGMLAVANADNEFQPSEQQVARAICVKLGLRPQEYAL